MRAKAILWKIFLCSAIIAGLAAMFIQSKNDLKASSLLSEKSFMDVPIEATAPQGSPRTREAELIVANGDDIVAKRLELVKLRPDNRVYMAAYVAARTGRTGNQFDLASELETLDKAERLDPDNAMYNYLKAGLILKKAGSYDNSSDEKLDWKILDKPLVEQAMREYLAGIRKPYCKSYVMDFTALRLKIIEPPRTLCGKIERLVTIVAEMPPAHLNKLRNLASTVPLHADSLIGEGKTSEAKELLDSWRPFLRRVLEESSSLLEVLVSAAIADIDNKELPPRYERLGMTDLAKEVKAATELTIAPYQEFKKVVKKYPSYDIIKTHGGLLATMLLPALGRKVSPVELAPGRHVEYVFFQRLCLTLLGLVLALLSVLSFAGWLTARIAGKAPLPSTPLRKADLAKALGLGVVLPLLAYWGLTSSELIGGYSMGLARNHWLAPQMIFMSLFVLVAVYLLTIRGADRNMRKDAVTTQATALPSWKEILRSLALFCALVFVFVILTRIYVFKGARGDLVSSDELTKTFFISMASGFPLWLILARHFKWIVASIKLRKTQECQYYGGMQKAVFLSLMLAVALISLVFLPIQRWREERLVRQDTLLFGSDVGFTNVENEVTEDLRRKMLEALGKLEPGEK